MLDAPNDHHQRGEPAVECLQTGTELKGWLPAAPRRCGLICSVLVLLFCFAIVIQEGDFQAALFGLGKFVEEV